MPIAMTGSDGSGRAGRGTRTGRRVAYSSLVGITLISAVGGLLAGPVARTFSTGRIASLTAPASATTAPPVRELSAPVEEPAREPARSDVADVAHQSPQPASTEVRESGRPLAGSATPPVGAVDDRAPDTAGPTPSTDGAAEKADGGVTVSGPASSDSGPVLVVVTSVHTTYTIPIVPTVVVGDSNTVTFTLDSTSSVPEEGGAVPNAAEMEGHAPAPSAHEASGEPES